MYIKMFSNKSGGGKGAVKYLLNKERLADGTAKVLSGNPEFTQAIIGQIKTKHKVTVGSINLKEGETLTQIQKQEIMEDFEKTLFAGLEKEQYNILWVEHTDKGRLELNFVIPKIELTTQKAFNPYFHNTDFARIDMFEDICNIKYNLESKKNPLNEQTLKGEKKHINLVKDYIKLDKQLHEMVESGDIKSREQLIELLNGNDIKVTRIGEDGISIKLPDSKKARRFKGSIYNEQFTSVGKLEELSETAEQRAREYNSRDTQRELETTIKRLEEYNDKKAQFNRGRFSRNILIEATLDSGSGSVVDRNIDGRIDSKVHARNSRDSEVGSAERDAVSGRKKPISESKNERHNTTRGIYIHENKGAKLDDFRRRATQRAREREETLSTIKGRTIPERTSLFDELRDNRESLYSEAKRTMQDRANDRERRRQYSRAVKQISERLTGVRATYQDSIQRLISGFNDFTTKFRGITIESRELIKTTRELEKEIISKEEVNINLDRYMSESPFIGEDDEAYQAYLEAQDFGEEEIADLIENASDEIDEVSSPYRRGYV